MRRRNIAPIDLNKQRIYDWQHRITSAIGAWLVLVDEGKKGQSGRAWVHAKSEYLKLGSEMKKLSQKMGEKYETAVASYLDSVEALIHCGPQGLDQAKIRRNYAMNQQLEKEVRAA